MAKKTEILAGTDNFRNRGMTRRQALKTAGAIGALTAAAAGGYGLVYLIGSNDPELKSSVVKTAYRLDLLESIEYAERQSIETALRLYIKTFGSKINEITIGVGDFSAFNTGTSNKIERSEPGLIEFDTQALRNLAQRGQIPLADWYRKTTLHAATHATKRAEITYFGSNQTGPLEFNIDNGTHKAAAAAGFILLYKDNNGGAYAFPLIEEGLADAAGAFLDPEVAAGSSTSYTAIAQLTQHFVDNYFSGDYKEVVALQHDNDLARFTQIVVNDTQSWNNLGAHFDILKLVYEHLYDGRILLPQAQQIIADYRKK